MYFECISFTWQRQRKSIYPLLPESGLLLRHHNLPHPQMVWRHFQVFILIDVFHKLFQGELPGGRHPELFVRAAGPHIRKFLGFADINRNIIAAVMLANHLALVYILSRIYEKYSRSCSLSMA